MPPEIHLVAYTESSLEDMKKADIWSYGMTLYCLMNLGVDHPMLTTIFLRTIAPKLTSH